MGSEMCIRDRTSEAHLGNSLAAGDWERAGFDLTSLVFGLALCAIWPRLTSPSTVSDEPKSVENAVEVTGLTAQANKAGV